MTSYWSPPRTACPACMGHASPNCIPCGGAPDVCSVCSRPKCDCAALPEPDPSCSVCSDAHNKRVCARCARDPASEGWSDGIESATANLSGASGAHWGVGSAWVPSPAFRRVAVLLRGGATRREAALGAGCSLAYAQKVAKACGL